MTDIKRCTWASDVPKIYRDYHDREWGVPVFDDQILFEFLILEGFQAGLSWLTILKKRKNFRAAFDEFDAHKMADYGKEKISKLLRNPGIIRNKLKVCAAVSNARAFLKVQSGTGSFSDYMWDFVEGAPIVNAWQSDRDIPPTSPISDKLSKDLYQKGFKFVGSTIIYAHMQAVGMVNDHLTDCFRYKEVNGTRIERIKTDLHG